MMFSSDQYEYEPAIILDMSRDECSMAESGKVYWQRRVVF